MSVATPNLSAMGIQNPDQIVAYSLVRIAQDMDVLKVNYGRPEGSLLPRRRSYEFKRIPKPIAQPDGEVSEETRYEISPALSGALVELDQLLESEKRELIGKQQLKAEIAELREELEARLRHLSATVEALD